MKIILTILLSYNSLISFANADNPRDTINNWQVYNGGNLLKRFNENSPDKKIVLTKSKVRAIDTIGIKFNDDTPCFDCQSVISIKSATNETLSTIESPKMYNYFQIKTTALQVLAFKNHSSKLRFYHQENELSGEVFLFTFEIR